MTPSEDKNIKKDGQATENRQPGGKRGKRHWIKTTWLRRVLKTLMWLLVAVLLLPVLLYLPPVQRLAVDVAGDMVEKSTGMKLGIGYFRLSFPLDVHLEDVYVLEANMDTMVRARELVADVRLMPLLRLDLQLNRLVLNDGYYRMVSPDSSMVLKVNAGLLEVDDKSSADISRMHILLNKAKLRDGSLSLYMDVWKKKNEPDTAPASPTSMLIAANDLRLENFRFGMSMLPTIDTLDLDARDIHIDHAVVDLGKSLVKWRLASIDGGSATYLSPDPEWAKAHPAPPSEPSAGPPMRIMGDSISLTGFKALYATKGVRPAPGFDAGYIEVSDVAIGMKDFYNEASTVRLPLTLLRARERSGLAIVSGSGTVSVDSIGLGLTDLDIRTLYSRIQATADVPFALMALQPDAPMTVRAGGRVGLPDVEAFMPSLKAYTRLVPARKPLDFSLEADGSLSDITVRGLKADMPGVVSLSASGSARNPLDYKKLRAALKFEGSLSDPALADKFLAPSDIKVPAFTIKGTATANGLAYGTDFTLRSTAGDLAARGNVALTPETYRADIHAVDINVAQFMPTLGIGTVTADIKADGAGFNPISGKSVTNADILIRSLVYNRQPLHDIAATVSIAPGGGLSLTASSANPGLDFDVEGSGSILPDDYIFDITARLRDVDLERYGLSDSVCSGSGDIWLSGSASPGKWIYDVDLKVTDLDWNLPGRYLHLPGGVTASVKADPVSTAVYVNSQLTELAFTSGSGLERVVDSFTKVADLAARQVDRRSLAVDSLSRMLPQFDLTLNASGRGLLGQFLAPSGMSVDTVYARIGRDSLITGHVGALSLNTGSMRLDTITLNIKERGHLLDYQAHLGNRPGTFDEFAQVNLRGYVGNNRLSAFLTQQNIKRETGYRIGLTAAMVDSTASVHITPLKATIAYLPWTINDDNYLDYNFNTRRLDANLMASSQESSIMVRTETENDVDNMRLKIDNLHIEDFLRMWALAPDVTGDVNADLKVGYDGKSIKGSGTLGVGKLTYERKRVGDLDLDLDAGYGLDGSTNVLAALRVNGEKAMSLFANLVPDETNGLKPDSVGLSLTRFPLKIANPFLGQSVVLGGYLNGNMRMDGSFARPVLNGEIEFDSVRARVPMMDATLRFEQDTVGVADNVVRFSDFNVFGANENPLSLNGTVNAANFSNILFDLRLAASNMQLIKSDRRSKGDIFGKIFLNLNAGVKGPMNLLDIDGNVSILGTTDATYRLNMAPAELQASTQDNGVVKFVNFNDSTLSAEADSVVESPLNMRINADLSIAPGTHIQVLLSTNGTDKVELSPTANLHYFQNYMGDMTLNGTLTLGQGYARYSVPVVGEKMFDFDPASTIVWNGNLMNPTLNVTATDEMKANVTSGNSSRLVNFLVTLHATNTLDRLKVAFDLATNDDLAIQNELQSMSADQRQTQAMNLLLYGQYTGQNTKATANLDGNFLYSFLESQINSWAAKHVRGVDLSFGINQYDKTRDGSSTTTTSYSYQVSKSLFNNRFKVQVGGNYSTDASADENLAQNLISDVSVEYVLKQTNTTNMAVRLFRHTGFESILEGEITEMGAGFVMKRRLESLKSLFRIRWGKKKKKDVPQLPGDSAISDTTAVTPKNPAQGADEDPKR